MPIKKTPSNNKKRLFFWLSNPELYLLPRKTSDTVVQCISLRKSDTLPCKNRYSITILPRSYRQQTMRIGWLAEERHSRRIKTQTLTKTGTFRLDSVAWPFWPRRICHHRQRRGDLHFWWHYKLLSNIYQTRLTKMSVRRSTDKKLAFKCYLAFVLSSQLPSLIQGLLHE